MSVNLISEITAKAMALPFELQQETLAYIESLINSLKQNGKTTQETEPPFQSVYGIIPRRIENLDEDLAEIRREMWKDKWDALAQEIDKAWQGEKSALEELAEMRR
ncbi:MAG: hypothetical protein ACREEM_45750 [Blastocatellia bacterium]